MKPILFSTEMVRAILDGRKTMTRRINKDANEYCEPLGSFINNEIGTYAVQNYGDKEHTHYVSLCERKMPWRVGEILWVRETWNCLQTGNGKMVPLRTEYWYKADDTSRNPDDKWRPSIFMPRDAARIFLRVTDVRVERLRDITIKDCIKEGVLPDAEAYTHANVIALNEFIHVWDFLNTKHGYGWDTNPWVWVISFERTERPKEV